jgi:hypothetical protein
MGLDFAIDELYATGWSGLDSASCEFHADGRSFPSVERIKKYFAQAGFTLTTRHIQLFDCYRAEWRDASNDGGAVVGQSEKEAAVYALSQLRRQVAALSPAT